MRQNRALDASGSASSSDTAGRFFIIACCLAIATGLVATAGMLLAAAAFATASTFVIPFIVTFEGSHDAGGTNAVTITGSWVTAGALTLVLAGLLSLLLLRRFEASNVGDVRA
jgi:hypothetical protein